MFVECMNEWMSRTLIQSNALIQPFLALSPAFTVVQVAILRLIPPAASKLLSLLSLLLLQSIVTEPTGMILCQCLPDYASLLLLNLRLLLFALRIKSALLNMAFQIIGDMPLLISLMSPPITLSSFCSSKTQVTSPCRAFVLLLLHLEDSSIGELVCFLFHSSSDLPFALFSPCFIFLITFISWHYVTFVYLCVNILFLIIMLAP